MRTAKLYKSKLEGILRCPSCGNGNLLARPSLATCQKCGKEFPVNDDKVFFTTPPFIAGASLEFNQQQKGGWTNWRMANFNFFEEKINKIGLGGLAIDLGTGRTHFYNLLDQKFSKVIGVDFRPLENTDIVCDLNLPLPFKDGICDIVFASNIFEHLPRPGKTMKECLRILKPGGFIVGTTPFLLKVHQGPYDFHRFTNYALEGLLRASGFTNYEVVSLGTPFEAYKQLQRHFFYAAYDTKPKNWGLFIRTIWSLGTKVLYKSQKVLNFIGSPLFNKCENAPDYTAGYGFMGQKPAK